MSATKMLFDHLSQPKLERGKNDILDEIIDYNPDFLKRIGNESGIICVNGITMAQGIGLLTYISENNVKKGGGTLITKLGRNYMLPVFLIATVEPPRPIVLRCNQSAFLGIEKLMMKQDYGDWTLDFIVPNRYQANLVEWIERIINERD